MYKRQAPDRAAEGLMTLVAADARLNARSRVTLTASDGGILFGQADELRGIRLRERTALNEAVDEVDRDVFGNGCGRACGDGIRLGQKADRCWRRIDNGGTACGSVNSSGGGSGRGNRGGLCEERRRQRRLDHLRHLRGDRQRKQAEKKGWANGEHDAFEKAERISAR